LLGWEETKGEEIEGKRGGEREKESLWIMFVYPSSYESYSIHSA